MKKKIKISLSEPHFFGKENKYLNKCIKSQWISSSGKFIDNFEKNISKKLKIKYVVALINCTAALQLSIRLLEPEKDDEIIAPTISFVATINPIIYNNCSPIFMDCDEKFLIDTNKTLEFLENQTYMKKGSCYNKKTGKRIIAIIIVHTFGNSVNLNKNFLSTCKSKNIKIIEDAAESLGTFYKKSEKKIHTGTIGEIGCLSFNGNKLVTSGGGGMIVTNKKKLAIKAKYLSTQAKDNPVFFIHNEVGYNYRLSNLHAAVGLAQLENLKKVIYKKKLIHKTYKNLINGIKGLKILNPPSHSLSNYWLNILMVEKKQYGLSKAKIMKILKKNGIETRSVWLPNHLQKAFLKFQKHKISKATEMHNKGLCLPSSYNLSLNQIKTIVKILKNNIKSNVQ